VPMITIETAQAKIQKFIPKKLKKEEFKPKVVLIVGRMHPADTLSSVWVEKIIQHLTSRSELSTKLRKHFIFKVVPMMCVDGVLIGNTLTSITGIDMEKDWRQPLHSKNPIIFELKTYLEGLVEKKGLTIFSYFQVKTSFQSPFCFVESNDYAKEDYMDRFLKIRFFPTALSLIDDRFLKKKAIYYKQSKKGDGPLFTMR